MAKSAFQARLSSVMEILNASAMKQICEIVDSDFACLRLELTRALHENAALSDKMHELESEVEILRNTKKESRSICVQTLEVSDSPSINGIFGKEWCSSLWDGTDPRTEERAGDVDLPVSKEPNDNDKLLSIKEEKCEKDIYPRITTTTDETEASKSENPSSPSDLNGIPEAVLDDDDYDDCDGKDDDDEDDIYLISAGYVGSPEMHPTPSASPGGYYPKIICMDGTVEHLIVPNNDQLEMHEHCVPIELDAGKNTGRQTIDKQGSFSLQDPVRDPGESLGSDQMFSYFDRFSVHQQSEPEVTKATLRCSDCNKVFIRQSNLTVHQKKFHQNQNVYTCYKCKVGFPKKNLLRTHKCLLPNVLTRTSNQVFSCDQCGKLFNSRTNLKVHYVVHTGEKPYRCSSCGRGFSQKGNLKTHERIHKGERPFICLICGKAYTQKVNLTHHLVVHSKITKCRTKKTH